MPRPGATRPPIEAIAAQPEQWEQAIHGVAGDKISRRPIPEMWSVAEYVDHVREVLFGMRLVVESALSQPGVDLGQAPEPRFDRLPRRIDVKTALTELGREAEALAERLRRLSSPERHLTAIIGGEAVDSHWVARHAVHDATHHLDDVERLRKLL
jgi:hypothetical protein